MNSKLNDTIKKQRKTNTDEAFGKLFAIEPNRQEDLNMISISKLIEFPDQPFKPYDTNKLEELAESIKEYGLINPVRVRKQGDFYQILSGHNRTKACKLLGWKEISVAIEENCDDDRALLIVIESNLMQRQKLLPSEKAFAYYKRYEVLKRQGKRTDLEDYETSVQNAHKSEASDKLANELNTSKDDIRRHIRLVCLDNVLLKKVDENIISFMVGVNLSYLKQTEQKTVNELLEENKYKISVKQAEQIRRLSRDGSFTEESVRKLFFEKSSFENGRENDVIKINRNRYKGYKDVLPEKEEEFKVLFIEFLEWLRERNCN